MCMYVRMYVRLEVLEKILAWNSSEPQVQAFCQHAFSTLPRVSNSPAWHRRARKLRSGARRRVRQSQAKGCQPSRRDLDRLRRHHSRPLYKSDRPTEMGKGGPAPRGGGQQYSERWRYWPGAWHSPRSRNKSWDSWDAWRQEVPEPSFPSYDGKSQTVALKKEAQAEGDRRPARAEADEDPGSMMTAELQEYVNATRKAEQRVRSLTATKKQKEDLWTKWQDDMRKAFLKEAARHDKAIENLTRDLNIAVAARDEARLNIRNYIANGGNAADMERPEDDDFDWTSMTNRWRQEQQDTDAPQAILRRAMGPPTGHPPPLPVPGQAAMMTPEAATRLFMAVMGGHMPGPGTMPAGAGEGSRGLPTLERPEVTSTGLAGPTAHAAPYVPSPSRGQMEPPPSGTSPPPNTRTGSASRPRAAPRNPVKGAPLQPIHPQHQSTLTAKLEAKRCALKAVETATAAAADQTGVPAPAPTFIPDDEDDDAMNTNAGNKGLDGMG